MIELRNISADSADRLLGETGYLSDHKTKKNINKQLLNDYSIKHQRDNGYKEIDLSYAKKVIDEALKNEDYFTENRGSLAGATFQEQWIAPRLHYSLRLTRSEAADPKLWNYLGLIFEDYIVNRWTGKGNGFNTKDSKPLEYHFLLKQWDRHQLAKLWWMAELTRSNGIYHPKGGIINTDIINYIVALLAPQSIQYNLAILEIEDDVLGDGEFVLNTEWIRAIYRLINRKILHESGSVKSGLKINYKEAEKWFNETPNNKFLTIKSKELPPAPKDIVIDKKEIQKVVDWIRSGIKNQISTEWKHLNDIAVEIIADTKSPLKREEIYEKGLEAGKYSQDWQKRELAFSLEFDKTRFKKDGSKWTLN